MNTKPVLLILSLLISVSLNAQNKISFGFKGGITLSRVSVTTVVDNPKVEIKEKAGINIGAYIDCIQTGNLTVSTGLYYCGKKADVTLTIIDYFGSPYTTSFSESVDYLIYGISARYHAGDGYVRPYVFAEPRLNFYLGDEMSNTDTYITSGIKKSASDNMKRFGFGFNFGAGIDFINSKFVHTFIEAQICPDLYNSFDNDDFKAKSTPIEIKIGFGF